MQEEVNSGNAAAISAIVLPTSMSKPFKDITITGNVLEDRSFIVRDSVLRIYLQLSDTAPLGWAYMFTNCWQALKEARPPAGIEGDSVWIECVPAELPEHHLPALEKCAAQTNECFRPSLRQKAVAQQAKRQLDLQARTQLQELRRILELPVAAPEPKQPGPLERLLAALSAARSEFKRMLKGS